MRAICWRVIFGRPLVVLAGIFVLALGLRVGWVGYTDTEIPVLSDPQYYHATASNLADGRGYTVAVDERGFVAGEAGEPTAFWAPGYSFALAPLYAVFGPDARVAKVFNAIVGALTVAPVWFLGRSLRPRAKGKGQTAKGEGDDRRSRAGGRIGEAVVHGEGAASGFAAAGETFFTTALGSSYEPGGMIAAFLFAVSPAMIFWTPALFSEALFTLGVACTLAVAMWAGDRGSVGAYFATGLILAATAFVRSQGLVLIVPLLVLVWPRRNVDAVGRVADSPVQTRGDSPVQVLRMGLPLVAGMAVLVVPWAVRNERAMGEAFLINDNLGYNLRLAHAPYSTGTSIAPRDLWEERPGISFRERELWWDEVGASRAWAYARSHPGREMELAVRRVGWLLRSDAAPAMRWSESLGATPVGGPRDALVFVGDVWWYGVLGLAVASVVVVRRDRVWVALWSAIGVWVGLHLVFAGEPRYHVPLVPVLCVLAGAVVVGIHHRGTKGTEAESGSR